MSNAIFPALAGLGWDVVRSPTWSNTVQQSISGKENRIALWTYPRWRWELTFNFLRQGSINQQSYDEFAQLAGFFNARQGNFDTFLYRDDDDNSATLQTIGAGDGATRTFNLVRAFGGFVEPIIACSSISSLRVDGVVQNYGTDFISLNNSYGTYAVQFTLAPAAALAITCSFQYYWPVRFSDDKIDFSKFMNTLYKAGKVSLISMKN